MIHLACFQICLHIKNPDKCTFLGQYRTKTVPIRLSGQSFCGIAPDFFTFSDTALHLRKFCRKQKIRSVLSHAPFAAVYAFSTFPRIRSALIFHAFPGSTKLLPSISPTFQQSFPQSEENPAGMPDIFSGFPPGILLRIPELCNYCNHIRGSYGKNGFFVFHKLWKTKWKVRENCGNNSRRAPDA